MDLAVLFKLFTALKDWLRIHVVLGHISDCKLIFHQKRAAKHHKHVSCLPDSDQRKKMETHSDTPTIMMKTVTKFWFFKKRRQYFTIYNQVSQYLYKKNVCLFLLLCTEFKCIPETCFLFLFFSLIPAPPHPSLSSLFPFFYFVFVSFFLVLQIFYRASIFTFLHFLKLLAHPFLQPPVTFHIYLCFSSSYLFLSLRSGNWGHIWPSRTWTLQQSVKQPCRSTMFGTNRAGIFRLWKVCLLGSLTMRVVRETPGSHMSLQV